MKKNAPRLVLVEWEDSAQPVPSWMFLDDLPAMNPVKCKSVGWIVGESKSVMMLAPNIGDFETSAQGSGFIRIPMRCITRVVGLVAR